MRYPDLRFDLKCGGISSRDTFHVTKHITHAVGAVFVHGEPRLHKIKRTKVITMATINNCSQDTLLLAKKQLKQKMTPTFRY